MGKLYCIAVGNLQTGMNFHGPFTAEDALDEIKHESINPKFYLKFKINPMRNLMKNKKKNGLL